MKCIIQAMKETEFKPRPKWWGFVFKEKRFLMRYGHCLAIFSKDEVLFKAWETVTDKRGVEFAIKYFKDENNNNSSSRRK